MVPPPQIALETQVTADLNHIDDPRARIIEQAYAASQSDQHRIPALVGVEEQRGRLASDDAHFDDRDGAISVRKFTRRVSKSSAWCRFLYTMTELHRPQRVVEMGTGVGISAAAIASALPGGAEMWTVDLRPESGREARKVLEALTLDVNIVTGRFDAVLEDVLNSATPVDLLFIDGHHQEEPTLTYTETAVPYLSPNALVIYDDIRWSDGMRRAWERVTSQQRWAFTADLGEVGVCAFEG